MCSESKKTRIFYSIKPQAKCPGWSILNKIKKERNRVRMASVKKVVNWEGVEWEKRKWERERQRLGKTYMPLYTLRKLVYKVRHYHETRNANCNLAWHQKHKNQFEFVSFAYTPMIIPLTWSTLFFFRFLYSSFLFHLDTFTCFLLRLLPYLLIFSYFSYFHSVI